MDLIPYQYTDSISVKMDRTWYDGEKIDKYLELISKTEPDKIYTFNTDFLGRFKTHGLLGIARWTEKSIFFSGPTAISGQHGRSLANCCLRNSGQRNRLSL